jgi:putative tricarboxylic transport membrane protein
MGPKGLTPAQIAYWEGTLAQVAAAPEWKTDLERNYLSGDLVLSAQFKSDLAREYADMKGVLTALGLAKN